MQNLLRPGQILRTEISNFPCTVKEFIKKGGQGEVYQVEMAGQIYALKWYMPASLKQDPNLRDRLKTLCDRGAPSDRFLWPIDLVSFKGKPEFGYIMPWRGEEYLEMSEILSSYLMNIRSMTTAGFELADSFSKLHIKHGMYYWDISAGNVFINPTSGQILICDNDNASGPDEAIPPSIYTPRFGAPEYLRCQTNVNLETDLYSLAVLLFCMFMKHHPLEGLREAKIDHRADQELVCYQEDQLYIYNPLFIFDPEDDSNCVVPDYGSIALGYWEIYPQFLRDLFLQAFTKGLYDPSQRVRESTWRETMVRLRDSIFLCPHCGAENFFEQAATNRGEQRCWNSQCQKSLDLPYRLRIGNTYNNCWVVLNPTTQLFPHHVDPAKANDFSIPIAEVKPLPQGSDFGILNCSSSPWQITTRSGSQAVLPGQGVMIKAGTRINFGKLEGEILL
jgi:eukaryotic-like serine/threonine-protein kinase